MHPIHLRNTSVIHPWLFFTYPHYSQNIRQDFTSLTFLRGHPQWHPLFRSIPLRMTTNAGISRKFVSSSVIFAIYIILVRDIDVIGKFCIHLHTQYIHSQIATLPSRNYPLIADTSGKYRMYCICVAHVLQMYCRCITDFIRSQNFVQVKIPGTEKHASADNCGRVRIFADLYKHVSRILRMCSEYQPILFAIHAQFILNTSVTGP